MIELLIGYGVGTAQILGIEWVRERRAHRRARQTLEGRPAEEIEETRQLFRRFFLENYRQGNQKMHKAIAAGVVTLASLVACNAPNGSLPDAERQAIVASVDSATRAFEAAQRARDAEAIVAHLAPDFYMYVDGVRAGYDSTVAGIRRTMPTMRYFEPDWEDVEVLVLGRDAASVSFTFHDLIVTETGDTLRAQGPTTLVWVRMGADWRIRYADADHYPATAPE
jgi:ketosteroid isomerase-like protein